MNKESPFNGPRPTLPFHGRPPRIVQISTAVMAVPTQGIAGMQLTVLNRTVCVDERGRAWSLLHTAENTTWEALPEIPENANAATLTPVEPKG